jgi:hypothetical protein
MKTYQKSCRDIIKAKFVALKWTSQVQKEEELSSSFVLKNSISFSSIKVAFIC